MAQFGPRDWFRDLKKLVTYLYGPEKKILYEIYDSQNQWLNFFEEFNIGYGGGMNTQRWTEEHLAQTMQLKR